MGLGVDDGPIPNIAHCEPCCAGVEVRTATKPPHDNYRGTVANSNKVHSLERISAASQAPAGVRPSVTIARVPGAASSNTQLGPDLPRQHLGERAPEGFARGRGGAEADAVIRDDDPALRADRDRDVAAALVRKGMAERVRDELVDQQRDRRGVALGDLEPREVEPDRDPPRVDAGRDLAGEILHEGADIEASGRVRRIEQAVRRRQRRDALRHFAKNNLQSALALCKHRSLRRMIEASVWRLFLAR